MTLRRPSSGWLARILGPGAIVLAIVASSCGEAGQGKIVTVRIEFEATAGGGVAATPPGVHADWPASFSLELVNHDLRPHAIAFTELGARYDVDRGTKDAPAVADYMLGISHAGTYHWRCVLGCPAPAVEGYVHVAPVG